jgi:hypothetical protein
LDFLHGGLMIALVETDPSTWNEQQVVTWLKWSQKKLKIGPESTDPAKFPTNGQLLCSWTVDNFVQVAGSQAGPLLAAALFWLRRPHHQSTHGKRNLSKNLVVGMS